MKDVVDALDRIVRDDSIQHILVSGDEVVVPLLNDQLPAHLKEKVVDVLTLEHDAGEDEIIAATLDVLRQKDAETDAERVAEVIGAWRARGLGVAGPDATLQALQMGQVDELLITARPEDLEEAEELVTRAQQTGARVRIIEDQALLQHCGGAAAALRFRIQDVSEPMRGAPR